VALFVSMLGLYALVMHVALGRTRELGIRRALGAPDARVASRVMIPGLRSVALGLVLGVAGALVSGKIMSPIDFELKFMNEKTNRRAA
jgi:putative ABC transport system permease protein